MTLVLVPGFMLDADLWTDLRPALHPFGPLIDADMRRGTGIDGLAAATLASDALAAAPSGFAVLGFSMGGYVARAMARMAPGRVRALVLIATSTRPDRPDQVLRMAAAVGNLAHMDFTGVSRSALRRSLHPDRADDAAMIERLHAMGARLGREAFVQQAGFVRTGDADALRGVGCPTLVVAAAQDALRSLDESRELAEGIPHATLAVIEGSGHMLPIEAPAALAAVLVPWLRATLPHLS